MQIALDSRLDDPRLLWLAAEYTVLELGFKRVLITVLLLGFALFFQANLLCQ